MKQEFAVMKTAEAAEAGQRSSGLFNKILLGQALLALILQHQYEKKKSRSLFTFELLSPVLLQMVPHHNPTSTESQLLPE